MEDREGGFVKTECKVRAWSQDTSQSGCPDVPERTRVVRFLLELAAAFGGRNMGLGS